MACHEHEQSRMHPTSVADGAMTAVARHSIVIRSSSFIAILDSVASCSVEFSRAARVSMSVGSHLREWICRADFLCLM